MKRCSFLGVGDKSDGRFRPLLKLHSLSCELHREGIGAVRQSAKVIDHEHDILGEAASWLQYT